ncbi:MAG: DNA topoisomerase I, partial ['Prunus persica' phytoplasma PP2]|nr:DNA topoisomerase I ['Prunus persica' phytoplasma PP2]
VFSQETRRMLDRIIGFKLSRLVRRLKSQSAGRVQSVALKLIVDLEEKIKAFVPEEYYIITAFFKDFQAEYQNPYKGKTK